MNREKFLSVFTRFQHGVWWISVWKGEPFARCVNGKVAHSNLSKNSVLYTRQFEIRLDSVLVSKSRKINYKKRSAMSENVPLNMCVQRRFRSACAFWIAKDAKFLHADNEDSNQTARMRRLIWVFVGRMCQKGRSKSFLTLRVKCLTGI